MKHLKKFNEEITNLSKKRKFPTYAETRGASDKNYKDSSDFYFLYHLPKEKRGDYLNTWFKGKNSMKDGVVLSDEMWTFKKTDKETSSRLYHKNYNPVAIKIYWPIGVKFQKGIDSYNMKAVIHSIDDSSFGVWWKGKPISELMEIRKKLMGWINYQPYGLNGEEFLKICVSMGADEETIDYD